MADARPPKNRYYTGSKIPENDFERIVELFIFGVRPSEIAHLTGYSPQTIGPLCDYLRYGIFSRDALRASFGQLVRRFVALFPEFSSVAIALKVYNSFMNTYPSPTEEIWRRLYSCLFECRFGVEASSMATEFGYSMRVDPKLGWVLSEISVDPELERMRLGNHYSNRLTYCSNCELTFTAGIERRAWSSIINYFSYFKNNRTYHFPYRLYHAFLIGVYCDLQERITVDIFQEWSTREDIYNELSKLHGFLIDQRQIWKKLALYALETRPLNPGKDRRVLDALSSELGAPG